MTRRRQKDKPLSEAQQVAIAAQVLQVMVLRHRSAGDGFKRASDEEQAQTEYGYAEQLERAQQILRQHRLLAPAAVHAAVGRVA